MPLAAGQSLTHYEILGPLGAGAMGEVYRARDTRLEREVALKVLPDELAGDEERLRRFEREARTLASLNHPNVAQVFGIDQVEDTCFMAMELVPGEDLAARLLRGALPLDEALDLCRQIAEGVEAAHEAGVIHRDLKPANVVITPEGKVKVLDFGLAKPADVDGGGSSTTDSALTTEAGRLLGTPTYMAPEQARGRAIDKRVDVWAYGCVLFECLSGRRVFDGETMGDVLAAVLEKEPDWSALPGGTPRRLRDLLRRCLRKDPRRRLRDVGDARLELEELGEAAPEAESSAQRKRLVPWLAVAALLVFSGVWMARWMGSDEPAHAAYSSIRITASQSHDRGPTWSPEGEWIAFSRVIPGSNDLFLRNVSSGEEIRRRSGPGDDAFPRWSPDGKYIATLSTGQPGTPVILLPPHGSGASGERTLIDTNMHPFDVLSQWGAMGSRPWREHDEEWSLLVSRVTEDGRTAVFRVGRDDGQVEQLTFPPIGGQDLYASYSFDQEDIVFVRDATKLMRLSAEGGEPEELLDVGQLTGYPSWRPDGRSILYASPSGLLELDVRTRTSRELTSWPADPTGLGGISINADGRVVYSTGWHDTTLTTLDFDSGATTSLTRSSGTNFNPRFSPDGREIAYNSDRTGYQQVIVLGLDGHERTITDSPSTDGVPDWSPDGERLIFVSERDGVPKLFMADRDGGNSHLVWDQALSRFHAVRWSPDSPAGEWIGCIVVEEGGTSLWGVRPDGTDARRLRADIAAFDWYLDGRRIVCTLDEGRGDRLVAIHLETGEMQELWTGPHAEIDVSPDGRQVLFAHGLGHSGMGIAKLELVPPADPDGLPTAVGEPVDLVRPDGPWHTHHGCWAPDARSIVYVHDADRANIYELVEQR